MGVVKRKDENIIDSRMVKNIMYQDKAPKVQMCFVQSLKTYYAFKTIEDYLCEVIMDFLINSISNIVLIIIFSSCKKCLAFHC